ncbi:hypothetical protein Ahy_B04g071843 isoform A [Arachis hypogaea]|uniref:Peptidase A1 domain-containing protein n=1 Tax=Arachis hypogaea TaxID=3818 RepID=A0A444ZLS1_ARAHY|nr:hypothetical protein Ahy_B04g071843 isoform A [Arachis hypogaea]
MCVEPPESPSLYIGPGAETSASQQVEVEEEIEEPEEVEPSPAAVPFSRLFACAGRFDWFLGKMPSFTRSRRFGFVLFLSPYPRFCWSIKTAIQAGSALAFTSAFIDFRGCNNWFNFWHHLGTVVATWNHVPRVERNVALPCLIRTFKMMGNYALTFVAIGGVYIGVKQLVQNARMKRDLVNGDVAFFFFLMVLSSTSSPLPPPPPSLSDGLSLELIPPHSPKSPFYHSNLVNPLVSPYKQGVVVKIGIGTIDIEDDVAYKSYLLVFDTGSDLIWIQCEECKIQDENHRCYPQKEEPFPDSKSRTYQPLPSSYPLCKYGRSDEKGRCIYTVKYKTGSINSTGVLSSETFRFLSTSSPSGTEKVREIVFGCGYKNYDDDRNDGDAYQIAGIFGMSPGPLSFLSQYKGKKFSYCMVPRHVKNPPPTYLRFASEVKPLTRFQTVDLLMTKATKSLFILQLEDLGVNGKRLRIDRRRLGNQQLVVDSGSTNSLMLNGAHEKLVSKLDSILITATGDFKKDVVTFEDQICYKRMRKPQGFTANIPSVNYYFKGGAHLDLPPQNVFVQKLKRNTEWFCFNIFPDQQMNLLGAYQQADFKFIFDIKKNKLQFGPENCAQNRSIKTAIQAGSALAFTSAFIDFRGCNNWFNFWHHLGTVVATWNHVPCVERNVALPGLIRTFKMMGNYALTFVAIGGVYIGVKQLVQNARMKRDLVNGAVDGWSVNVSANTGTGRSQYVNAGELSGSTSSHEGLNKLINIGVLALTLI